jgi:alkanesulfonate monooxygenase
MSIEIFGHLTHRDESEAHLSGGASIDPDYIERQAREHEFAGFDGVLVGGGGDGPDSLQIAAHAVAHTRKLNYLVAYRPGLISPTLAARAYATLDQISGGRIRLHAITGRDSDGQKKYGDPLQKSNRYERTREFIQILKKSWTERGGFDFAGKHFEIEGFAASIFPHQQPRIPIYFAGNSDEAFSVGASEADGYALYAQPLDLLKEDIARIHSEAKAAGRVDFPQIIVLVRIIIGATDELAWDRAEGLRADAIDQTKSITPKLTRWVPARDGRDASAGDRKQVEANKRGERHDKALWTGLSGLTERGKSTALVGSPETIVSALLDYVDAGVSTFILDGFNRLRDVPELGNYLLPLLRDRLAEHQSKQAAAVA